MARKLLLGSSSAVALNVGCAMLMSVSDARAACSTSGTTTVNVTCAQDTTTTATTNTASPSPATSDRFQLFGVNVVGQVNAGVTVNGAGLLVGGTGSSVTMSNNGTITNTNVSNVAALALEGTAGTSFALNNSGIIQQSNGGIAVSVSAAGGGAVNTVINNTGKVFGDIDVGGGGATSIFNSGTINGSITFGAQFSGPNTLTLGTTSKITGSVLGGGSDILQLGGTGSQTFDVSTVGNNGNNQYQGFSTFNKIGTSTWTLTGNSTFAGATTVHGGTLQVDGSIAASPVFVDHDALLTGVGTVGKTFVNGGGVLSPGHGGIGTLTVNGDLSLQAGSLYAFSVTSGTAGPVRVNLSNGLTQVNGTATLAGDAVALFQGNTFKNQYTILSATNGVNGQFQNFTTNSTAITATLAYGTNDVTLNLKSNLAGGGTGTPPGNGNGGNSSNSGPSNLTRNQFAVASALDNAFNTNGNTNGIGLTGLLPLSASQLPAAFDILSGEGTSATQETAFVAGQQFTSLMMQQGAFWRSGASADPNGVTYPAAPMSYAPDEAGPGVFKTMTAKAPGFEQRWRGWAAGFDGAQSLRGEAAPGSADQTHRTAGGAAGLDYQVNPNLLLGIAGGGSSSSLSVADRLTHGSLDGAHVGAYGVARSGAWYAAGTLAFATFDNKTSRTIAGVGPTESANGSFGSNLLSGRFELGWTRILNGPVFNGLSVTPFAAVEFAHLRQRGYSETGVASDGTPGVNGLSYAAHSASSLPTFLGVQLDSRFALASGMIWSPYARLSWVHEFERERSISAEFIALPGSAFTVEGARPAADAARVDLGSQLAITRNVALFGSFDGEFSDRSRMLTGKGGLDVKW